MAASHSSTELKVVKSGMDLSNNGWDGLEEERETENEMQWGKKSYITQSRLLSL